LCCCETSIARVGERRVEEKKKKKTKKRIKRKEREAEKYDHWRNNEVLH
jgi:hypothetical protein